MLVEATESDAAVACWRQRDAVPADCAAIVEDEVRRGLAFAPCFTPCSKGLFSRTIRAWRRSTCVSNMSCCRPQLPALHNSTATSWRALA